MAQCPECILTMHEVLGKSSSFSKVPLHALDKRCFSICMPCDPRKKNRRWKLLQTYLPHLGWGLLSLVTLLLAYQEHRASIVGQSLQTATQELKMLTTQQSQLQVCYLSCTASEIHHVCRLLYVTVESRWWQQSQHHNSWLV